MWLDSCIISYISDRKRDIKKTRKMVILEKIINLLQFLSNKIDNGIKWNEIRLYTEEYRTIFEIVFEKKVYDFRNSFPEKSLP